MKGTEMKEGKAGTKSKLKWVGLVGLVLSSLSISVHFFLARFTEHGFSEYQVSITIFSWRPVFDADADIPKTVISYYLLPKFAS